MQRATHQPSRIPPQARAAARSTLARARRAAQGQEERAAHWLQMTDRHFPCQFPAPIHATPRISFHDCCAPKRVALPGDRQTGPAGRPKARGASGAGPKWLNGSLLANFPAPIHATPRIKLHESRAPKREALPGDASRGPLGSSRPESQAARWLRMLFHIVLFKIVESNASSTVQSLFIESYL